MHHPKRQIPPASLIKHIFSIVFFLTTGLFFYDDNKSTRVFFNSCNFAPGKSALIFFNTNIVNKKRALFKNNSAYAFNKNSYVIDENGFVIYERSPVINTSAFVIENSTLIGNRSVSVINKSIFII